MNNFDEDITANEELRGFISMKIQKHRKHIKDLEKNWRDNAGVIAIYKSHIIDLKELLEKI